MKIRKITGYFCLLVTIYLLLFSARQANAQSVTCAPVFGGGSSTCQTPQNFTINKQIQVPGGTAFKDNITDPDPLFKPGQTIVFRIIVKNTSNSTISNIKVSDPFPDYIVYKSSNGDFNTQTRTFSATIDKLDKGQTKVFTITSSIKGAKDIPDNPSPLCSANLATAVQNNKSIGDLATYCINKPATNSGNTSGNSTNTGSGQTKGGLILTPTPRTQSKGGLPIYGETNSKKTPSTGPESLALLSLPSLAAIGYWIRRK